MPSIIAKFIALVFCLTSAVKSQNTTTSTNTSTTGDYLDKPVLLWTKGIGQVESGNGAFISPDGSLLVVVGADTSIRGIDPKTGEELWSKFNTDTSAKSFGGAFFSEYLSTPYVMYSVAYNAILDSATSAIFAYDYDGELLFNTEEFAGVAVGTPVASSDGSMIMTTHTVSGTTGHFSVFNYGEAKANFTYKAVASGNSSIPFGAIGYFYSPAEGNFPEGMDNTNDLFIWSASTPEGAAAEGAGQLFAFQKPLINQWDKNASSFQVIKVGNSTSFQSPNAPALANKGYLMYISATQSELRYWAGSGLPRDHFDRGSKAFKGFERGAVRWAAAAASPTVDFDLVTPRVYGPTASTEVFGCNTDISSCVTHTTTEPLTNKVQVSPDNLHVYYAVAGSLTQLAGSTLAVNWNVTVGTGLGPIKGEIAVTPNGRVVYVADGSSGLHAFQVMANATGSSPAPTAGPIADVSDDEVSDAPSMAPSIVPGSYSTKAPVTPPVRPPSAPVPAPTSAAYAILVSRSYLGVLAATIMFVCL